MTRDTRERYAVYHANDLHAMVEPQAEYWFIDRATHYKHVADVVAPLERVFALTNHIDSPWMDNPEVVWHTSASPVRSTSVGDVIVSHRDGGVWLILPIGLYPLGSHETEHPFRTCFPFGATTLADYTDLWHRYREEIPFLARQVILPPSLPCRHPALSQLEGRYPIVDHLPPWWESCLDLLTRQCPCLEPLLRETSREEFRRGSLNPQLWSTWRRTSCQEKSTARRLSPCRYNAGPGLFPLMATALPAGERGRWLDRFVNRGAKDMPLDLDVVITAHPAWWLNMANGRNWFSCMGTGPYRDPRLPGNWYDTGVALAALVARGGDCWTPDVLIARTTLRVVTEDLPVVGEQDVRLPPGDGPAQRVVLGRVYHNDHTAACTLLSFLIDLCEKYRLPWGCIAGTPTTELLLDGSLSRLDLAREPQQASGIPYWLPAHIERPAREGQVAYLERDEPEACDGSTGSWTFPVFGIHACQRRTSAQTTPLNDHD